jgi:hypothetical protein
MLGGRATASQASEESNFLETLSAMQFSYLGAPFVQGATQGTTDLQSMAYAYDGAPFVVYGQ